MEDIKPLSYPLEDYKFSPNLPLDLPRFPTPDVKPTLCIDNKPFNSWHHLGHADKDYFAPGPPVSALDRVLSNWQCVEAIFGGIVDDWEKGTVLTRFGAHAIKKVRPFLLHPYALLCRRLHHFFLSPIWSTLHITRENVYHFARVPSLHCYHRIRVLVIEEDPFQNTDAKLDVATRAVVADPKVLKKERDKRKQRNKRAKRLGTAEEKEPEEKPTIMIRDIMQESLEHLATRFFEHYCRHHGDKPPTNKHGKILNERELRVSMPRFLPNVYHLVFQTNLSRCYTKLSRDRQLDRRPTGKALLKLTQPREITFFLNVTPEFHRLKTDMTTNLIRSIRNWHTSSLLFGPINDECIDSKTKPRYTNYSGRRIPCKLKLNFKGWFRTDKNPLNFRPNSYGNATYEKLYSDAEGAQNKEFEDFMFDNDYVERLNLIDVPRRMEFWAGGKQEYRSLIVHGQGGNRDQPSKKQRKGKGKSTVAPASSISAIDVFKNVGKPKMDRAQRKNKAKQIKIVATHATSLGLTMSRKDRPERRAAMVKAKDTMRQEAIARVMSSFSGLPDPSEGQLLEVGYWVQGGKDGKKVEKMDLKVQKGEDGEPRVVGFSPLPGDTGADVGEPATAGETERAREVKEREKQRRREQYERREVRIGIPRDRVWVDGKVPRIWVPKGVIINENGDQLTEQEEQARVDLIAGQGAHAGSQSVATH